MQIELEAEVAIAFVLERFAPVVEAAHMDAPRQIEGFSDGLDP